MSLFPGEKVYDEYNYRELVGDGATVFAGGERRWLSRLPPTPAQEAAAKGFATSWEAAGIQLIPDSEFDARIQEQEQRRSRTSDFCDFPPFDQDGLPTCWANGPAQSMTIQRRLQGLPYKQISACSFAVPISGGHVGGYEGDAYRYAIEHGGVSVDLWPNNGTRNLNSDQAIQSDRENHKLLGYVDCGNDWRKWATCCLLNMPGGFAYNWMGHVMCMCDFIRIEAGAYGFRVRNSWGNWGAANPLGQKGFATYRVGHGTPNSGWCITGVTQSVK